MDWTRGKKVTLRQKLMGLESGRGVVVTPEQLDEVNIIWRNEKYKDERAAMEDGGLKDAKKN
jgi:hypothetical protein